MNNFLSGVVASIVAAILISIGAKLMIGWKKWPGFKLLLRMNKDLISSGVINFFPSRKTYISHRDHGKASEYIKGTKYELIYTGFWLASSTEMGNIIEVIKQLVENNIKVIIILMDPSANCIDHFSNYTGLGKKDIIGRINSSIEKFISMYNSLSIEGKNNFQLRLHNVPLSSSSFIIDKDHEQGKILVDFKIYGLSRDDSFGIEVQNKKSILYDKFKKSNLAIFDKSEGINCANTK